MMMRKRRKKRMIRGLSIVLSLQCQYVEACPCISLVCESNYKKEYSMQISPTAHICFKAVIPFFCGIYDVKWK